MKGYGKATMIIVKMLLQQRQGMEYTLSSEISLVMILSLKVWKAEKME